ncbi:hypothetical protein F511_06734 [Dorcoceras hygrometricum]|uniref:C2 NT-type domain-containing protein n=1 Tax=Dorcoceras hygrometricum TaxID=472368 RepID=A0A2Z7D8A6_9LAMI|nr:hypothetical protein F511_06734 [Dorcoceras hygrometricum]
MVVKMINWRASSKKFVANITVHQLKGIKSPTKFQDPPRFSVEIKWRGSKGTALSSLRRSVRRNFTKEEIVREEDGVVEWNEEFQSVCNLSICKDGIFHPWEVSFTVFNVGLGDEYCLEMLMNDVLNQGSKQDPNNKAPILATASLNLADFATIAAKHASELDVPVVVCGNTDYSVTSLSLSISLLELKNLEETSESTSKSMFLFPRSPCYGEVISQDKEELPDIRTGSKKSNTFNGIFSQRFKRTCHEEEVSDGRSSTKSEDTEFTFPLETESSDDSDERDSKEVKDASFVRKSFNYGTLVYANHAGVSVSNTSGSEDEDWIYFSHRNSDVGQVYSGDTDASKPDKSSPHGLKSRLLPWRKRKLSFRSPKTKGEPLLKNYYGEEGGDDIDFDRRQLGSSDETTFEKQKTEEDSVADQPPSCVFGDDSFAVGVWEDKEIVSRDGLKKLKTQVFFASIDQRSERAAGESACTALVAVIADWLQSNHDEMPIKSQLDSLIREGSLEWRNLCENGTYRERFPDKHFDLETVLEAKIRPLSVVPEISFVGFFHLTDLRYKGFDFLQGAMSFDSIWDEMCIFASKNDPSSNDPLIYIISWNDHFFVLKIEHDCCYIIDTLGERLFEGCNQAFILKFDRDTTIYQIEKEARESDEKSEKDDDDSPRNGEESSVLCMGKDSCKEYIKSFLAAIPIRELEDDLKKGLVVSTSIHHRLQIEFHFTRCLPIHKTESPVILSLGPTEPDEL